MAALKLIAENALLFALVFAGIWAVKKLLHKQLSPAMHYLLWAVVLLKLLIPVALPSAASPWNLIPTQPALRAVQLANPSTGMKPPSLTGLTNDLTVASLGNAGAALTSQSAATGNSATSPAPQSTANQATKFGLADLVVLLWLCGAAAFGAILFLRYRKLGKLLRASASKAIPPDVQRELTRIRFRLGIKTPVRVVFQATLPVPAIMGFFKPVILLPNGLAADTVHLRNALLHELSHWKRGDLFVLRLMNLLSVLYWFNPLVWFCFKLVRRDMETACDSMALKALDGEKRIAYIKTVLHFAGSGRVPSTHAAMSLNDGNMAMKKRVEGMYLRSKTGIKAKATACLLALIMALTSFTTACQPNPTVPPVVGKGDLASEIVDNTAGPSAAPAPTHVKFSAQQGKLIVNVDANVEVPSTNKLPVVNVAPRKFTQAEADNFIKVLFQGKTAYGIKDYLTKKELNEMIVDLKAQKSKMKKGDRGYDDMDSSIASYESQLATAPDNYERKPADGKFKAVRDGNGNQAINVTATLGKNSNASLNLMNSQSGRTCSLWFTNKPESEDYLGEEYALDGQPQGVKMSLADAKALAEKTAKDLGSDLKLATCSLAISRNTLETGDGKPTGKQAYQFMFTREVNGVTSTYEQDGGGGIPQDEVDKMNSGKEQFIEPHEYERLVIAVNDSGVVELLWTSPDEVKNTVSDDAKTLSFDSVIDTFKKQFFIHNALSNRESDNDKAASNDKNNAKGATDNKMTMSDAGKSMRAQGIYSKDFIGDDKDIKTCTYTINRVVLGLTRIAIKDKQDEFMIVPVYDFFGSVQVEYTKESGLEGFVSTNANVSFLTVNAIDGSIINRSYGY